jgi:hypothetical protein
VNAIVNIPGQIRLYALADPALLTAQSSLIQAGVIAAAGARDASQCQVTISDSTSSLGFLVKRQLWTRTARILPSRDDALRAAETFITRADQQLSAANAKWPKELASVHVLPPLGLLRRAELIAALRPDGSAWDHWLYRAEPLLMLDDAGTTSAPVFGALVEVRVGNGGQILSLSSRWRPITGEMLQVPSRAYVPEAVDTSQLGPTAGDSTASPVLGYLFEGEGVPQHYLAPYWFKSDGDSLTPSSASAWSLTVDVGRTQQGADSMTLTALAQGGSGQYEYSWAAYLFDEFEQGFTECSGATQTVDTDSGGKAVASTIQLSTDVWVVLLNVRDAVTGAFKHHQQLVYAAPNIAMQEIEPLIS